MSLLATYDSPFRQTDWCWQRAKSIAENVGLPTTKRRDSPQGYKWIRQAVTFIQRLQQVESDRDRALLAEQQPDFFWAHWIYTTEANPQKYSIEAHILAQESDYDIGFRTGIAPAVITAYEALFFNVRDKLRHQQYILNCVIGPDVHQTITEQKYFLLWKLYAYFLGPFVLEALESKFSNPTWCGDANDVGAAVIEDAIGTLKLKAALAAKTVPINQTTQIALMEQFTKFVEVERNSDSEGKTQVQLLSHVDAMMSVLPFSVGGRDPRAGHTRIAAGPFTKFENAAIELTYEETIRLATGQSVPSADEAAGLTFDTIIQSQTVETSDA